MIQTTLSDDGSLDTVIECQCDECGSKWTERISQETAAEYRKFDGTLTAKAIDWMMDDLGIECDCDEH